MAAGHLASFRTTWGGSEWDSKLLNYSCAPPLIARARRLVRDRRARVRDAGVSNTVKISGRAGGIARAVGPGARGPLLPDTELGEDAVQQVFRRGFAGDQAERVASGREVDRQQIDGM